MTQHQSGLRLKDARISKNKIPIFSLALMVVLLGGCSANWGWYVIDPTLDNGMVNLRFLLSGLWHTISLSLTAISISIVVGLVIALPGITSRPLLKGINRVYVEIVRSVPILVLILWVYYGLPQLMDLSI
ncbi:MAG: hypothetical protein EBS81_13150, partial [Gammaproteobacteria bacterium]|nr:hypothetical protein [Gammaproteobacteria bacterium]